MYYSLNTILYGPPGTGKTWKTAQYAVSIIEGTSLAKLNEETRADTMGRFKSYLQNGQIEFVTPMFNPELQLPDCLEAFFY